MGFSLFEVVVVLSMTGLVLFTLSRLLSQTFETLRFLQEKSQTLESATLGGERLTSELREAVFIEQPIPLGQVKFQKVRPVAPEAVGNPLETPANELQRTYGAIGQLGEVNYQTNAEARLIRTVAGRNSTVADEVNAFVVSPFTGSQSTFVIRLSLTEKRRVITFESLVTCPALEAGFAP